MSGHEPSDEQSTRDASGLSEVVNRFEEAWQQNKRPKIEEYLPQNVSARGPALRELIQIDLERRLKAGEGARVEDYLQRFPELNQEPTVVIALIEAELRLRQAREPKFLLEDFLQRFRGHRRHAELYGAGTSAGGEAAEHGRRCL
jgi:hypothetical protein